MAFLTGIESREYVSGGKMDKDWRTYSYHDAAHYGAAINSNHIYTIHAHKLTQKTIISY